MNKNLEIDILLYNGKLNTRWIYNLLKREDIIVNVYLYKTETRVRNKNINIYNIPDNINTYGGAYNYIIDNVKCKYFMLLDNLDYLNINKFNKVITPDILKNDFDLIKDNTFIMREYDIKMINQDKFIGDNQALEDGIINREIFPYFFGSRIYNTKLIKDHDIRFLDTDIYNDIYPNILLIRNIRMDKVYLVNEGFYTRNRMKWDNYNYNNNDLKKMIESLFSLNIPKDKILIRLVDSYNYSVNERNCSNQYYLDTVKEFYDIEIFKWYVKKRADKAYYLKK